MASLRSRVRLTFHAQLCCRAQGIPSLRFTKLNGFLGGLRGGDPRGAALCGRKRDGRNGPRGAVEQHVAPASGPFCAHDVVLLQVGADARGLFVLLFLHGYNQERAILLK